MNHFTRCLLGTGISIAAALTNFLTPEQRDLIHRKRKPAGSAEVVSATHIEICRDVFEGFRTKKIPFDLQLALANKSIESIRSGRRNPLLGLSMGSETLLKFGYHPAFFRDPVFLKSLQKFSEADLLTILEAWYGRTLQYNFALSWDKLAKALPLDLRAIATDPGILSRSDEFISFFSKWQEINPGPYAEDQISDLRAAFSSQLGDQIVYRALAVTNLEANGFKHEGLSGHDGLKLPDQSEVGGEKRSEEQVSAELTSTAKMLLLGPANLMASKILGEAQKEVMSVTSFVEIAQGVAVHYRKPGRKILVYKLKVPTLDLIDPRKLNFHRIDDSTYSSKFGVAIGDRIFMRDSDGLEHIIFGTIPASWIQSVRKYDGVDAFRNVDKEGREIKY